MAPEFNCSDFVYWFPYFKDFDCEEIELRWDVAEFYLPQGICLDDKRAKYLWAAATAHLLYLDQKIEHEGPSITFIKSAQAGDTSVTYERIMPKGSDNSVDAFFSLSPYGARVLTLLNQERYDDLFAVDSQALCGRVI